MNSEFLFISFRIGYNTAIASASVQSDPQAIPALFTDPACGHVLRAKGFVQDENGWVKLNATADGLTANAIPKGQEVLIVIGEGLEKERIEVRLKG